MSDAYQHARALAYELDFWERKLAEHGDPRGFMARKIQALTWALDVLEAVDEFGDDVRAGRAEARASSQRRASR
jgi:hypothetical protein